MLFTNLYIFVINDTNLVRRNQKLVSLRNKRFFLYFNYSFRIDQCHQESCDQVNNVSEMTVQRLLLELETGGNVRFEDGKPTDPWYLQNLLYEGGVLSNPHHPTDS